MTAVGLGLAALGRPAYINLGHGADLGEDRSPDALRARTHEVLDHAYARGVRYFDAARSYGLAEEFLGGWLRSRSPAGVTVASKWGYTYTANWLIDVAAHEVKDLTAATLRRQLAETREHLGEWLQLYQIHSATIESGVLEDGEVLGELAALREAGVAIGLTATGAGQAATIDRAVADRRLRRGAGDVEPARARGRPGARGRARGRPARGRQGGRRQRAADRGCGAAGAGGGGT